MNDSLKHLNRYSTPAKALIEPAPDDAQLRLILKTALSAPDHGRLHPYRFISIRGKARRKLSEIFGQATLDRDPGVDPAYLTKQKDKPLRSPLDRGGGGKSDQQPEDPRDRTNAQCRGGCTQRAAGRQRTRLRFSLAHWRQRLRRLCL